MTAHTHPHFEPPPEPDVEDVEMDAGHYFAEEFGTTVAEQRRHEPIDARLRREEPDGLADERFDSEVAGTALPELVHVDEPGHWNLLVTVRPGREPAARALVSGVGTLRASPYPDDVLLAHVDDAVRALDQIDAAMKDDPRARAAIARVLPAQRTFACSSLDQLERVTRDLVGDWLDELADTRFHVRCHRRGRVDDIDPVEEEAFLGEVVLSELAARGTPGTIDFDDPDAVIDIEILGGIAAASLWTRDDLRAYPFLRIE